MIRTTPSFAVPPRLTAPWLLLAAVTLPLALALAAPAAAQSDAEYLSAVNFRFANPGARARGLGGAFVALADDATAAVVNPAGLAYLDQAELSIEFVSEEDKILAPRIETGVRGPSDLRPLYPPRRGSTPVESEQLSFASVIFPVKRHRFVVGLFYTKPLDTAAGGGSNVRSVNIDGAAFPAIAPGAFFPTSSFVAAKNEVAGVAGGLRLGDRFSVGGSIGISQLTFEGFALRSNFNGTVNNIQSSLVDQETALFATVGGLWRVADRFSIGGSWQVQTSYDMDNQLGDEFGSPLAQPFTTELTIPTRWTLGAAWHITPNWVAAVEVDRIEYSDLIARENETFFGRFEGDATYGYELADITELHLGTEYNVTAKNGVVWSFRAGYWRDTTHPPYYTGSEPSFRAWAPRIDEDIHHYTAGFGFEGKKLIIDVAADYAPDAGTDLLASVVLRIGKAGS